MPNSLHRFLESLESRTLLHAGDIDPAFNFGQLQTTAFPNFTASASIVDSLPDGSFLVGGTVNQYVDPVGIGIAKYNFNGSLDTTFGTNGEITGSPGDLQFPLQIANTPDGGFLVLGWNLSATNDTVIAKYTAAGDIDKTFGKDGILIPSSLTEIPSNIAVDSSGRILVPGTIGNNAVLLRYLPDGSLDTSFASNGTYTEDATPSKDSTKFFQRLFNDVAITPSGNLIVTGTESLNSNRGVYVSSYPIVREVTTHGRPVKQFDSTTDADSFSIDNEEDVAGITANGNIVLCGNQLIELQSSGAINTLFGINGIAGITPDDDGAATVAVAPDGSIVIRLSGSDNTEPDYEFALRRILPNGKIDKNFGTNGTVRLATTMDSVGGIGFNIGVAIAPDGTILAASEAGGVSQLVNADTRQFEIARVFANDGPAVQLIPTTTKSSVNSRKVTVLIRDNDGIDTSTLDNNDLRFVDSDSLFLKMHLISFTPIDGNDYIQATYSFSAPPVSIPGDASVGWYPLDGNYQIRLAGSQIDDLLGNPAEAQILGTVNVNIPPAA